VVGGCDIGRRAGVGVGGGGGLFELVGGGLFELMSRYPMSHVRCQCWCVLMLLEC
jgi:hypothetical protein